MLAAIQNAVKAAVPGATLQESALCAAIKQAQLQSQVSMQLKPAANTGNAIKKKKEEEDDTDEEDDEDDDRDYDSDFDGDDDTDHKDDEDSDGDDEDDKDDEDDDDEDEDEQDHGQEEEEGDDEGDDEVVKKSLAQVGVAYYYNLETSVAQWTCPEGFTPAETAASAASARS